MKKMRQIIVSRAAGVDGDNLDNGHYCASHMRRLIGHEGSIFRIVWSLDVLPGGKVREASALDDWVALGDGKGNMTLVRVIGDMYNPLAGSNQSWRDNFLGPSGANH
ncbi:unnamed protein product [Microthlaspi erraticum]|uniref:Uncharacterized protein n=1 Tax=Microthlaspi erraticum TaxID=1685480 RepID=A0A6D2K1G1_9BRAS|nr:unnamed protein product [Microthlaspi erraticum]